MGVTGVANALEAIIGGPSYGSDQYIELQETVLRTIRDTAYMTSVSRAMQKGPFPLFDKMQFGGEFFASLPIEIQEHVYRCGIRNSHLLSIAPTGTISLSADNVSSSIEPVFSHSYSRTIQEFDGPRTEQVTDYGYRVFGIKGKTAEEVTPEEHVKVLCSASKFVDSAVSKTCNVGKHHSWEDFKNLYIQAYEGGASGCTTFRSAGKRFGILNADEGQACTWDPETGTKTCE